MEWSFFLSSTVSSCTTKPLSSPFGFDNEMGECGLADIGSLVGR